MPTSAVAGVACTTMMARFMRESGLMTNAMDKGCCDYVSSAT